MITVLLPVIDDEGHGFSVKTSRVARGDSNGSK